MIEMCRNEIEDLLANELIGRLAMADTDGRPYVIPMPFCWKDDSLYLRLPMKGRKGSILSKNDLVCFEVDWTAHDMSDYASVLIEGRLAPVEDLEEKRFVRLCNDLKYMQLRGAGRKGHGRATPLAELTLLKIVVSRMSGRKKEQLPGVQTSSFKRAGGCPVCGSEKNSEAASSHTSTLIGG